MDLGLAGRRALVTASSRGMGRAIATALGREGVDLVLCARGGDRLAETAGCIRSETGVAVRTEVVDLGQSADVDRLVAAVTAGGRGVDILVFNAAGPRLGGFFAKSEADWHEQLQQHFFSAMRLLRGLLPGMTERQWGRVIAVVSRTVKEPRADNVLSGAVRLPMLSVLRTLATELGGRGVTLNAVCPGPFATERLLDVCRQKAVEDGSSVDEQLRRFADGVAVGRVGQPEEIGAVCAFLASRQAAFVTGQTIMVDGGSIRSLF